MPAESKEPADDGRPLAGPRSGSSPTPDRRRTRRALLLVALSAAATVCAVLAPPVGLGLGVVTLIGAIAARRDLRAVGPRRLTQIITITGGVVAVLVGGVLSLALLVIGDEIRDYQRCHAGANTHLAEQRCQDQFMDAVERRFGPGGAS